eukprot:scaffold607_cov112-Isochrysis_galbana.AAC.5
MTHLTGPSATASERIACEQRPRLSAASFVPGPKRAAFVEGLSALGGLRFLASAMPCAGED